MAGNLKRVKKNRLLTLRQRLTVYGEVIVSVEGLTERRYNAQLRRERPGCAHAAATGETLLSFHSRSWESLNTLQCRMQIRSYIQKDSWFNTEPIVGRRGIRRIIFVEEDSNI